MKIGLFVVFLLFNVNAWATTKLTHPSYFKTINSSDVNNPILYAGRTTSTCTSADKDRLNPCNSCKNITTFTTSVCSDYEVYPELYFTLTLNSSQSAVSGSSKIVITDGTNSVAGTIISSLVDENVDVQVRWTWEQLCEEFGGSATCSTSFSKSLRVGFTDGLDAVTENSDFIGSDYAKLTIKFRYAQAPTTVPWCKSGVSSTSAYDSGFCYFNVFPGDEKVFISTLHWDFEESTSCSSKVNFLKTPDLEQDGTPDAFDDSGIKYQGIRVFYAEGSTYASVSPQSPYQDIGVSDCDLNSDMVKGLKNDTNYVFNIANIDQAGIVSYFADTGQFEPADFLDSTKFGTVQSARPQAVYGLLKDKSCFIATASFGTDMAEEVNTLREFRNKFLLSHPLGRAFVKGYYFVSPPIAHFIAQNDVLRTVIRGLLWPIILFAELSLKYGLGMALLALASLMTVIALMKEKLLRR